MSFSPLKSAWLATSILGAVAIAHGAAAQTTPAGPAAQAGADSSLGEIVVTARRREEKLQDVPDAVTVVTQQKIVSTGVRSVGDLATLTPNLNFRDGSAFSAGYFDLRMRGIGEAQQGWPSVAFVIDGVPAVSPDEVSAGSLANVQQIEVLRGPQSALYGSGAIAGAINITTKRPTDTVEGDARLYYGAGNDLQAGGQISGPILKDKLVGRLTFDSRDSDGLIKSATNGIPLDFHHMKQVGGRAIWTPTNNFEADLRATYVNEHDGFSFQDLTLSDAFINTFSSQYNARRDPAGVGNLNREFTRFSGRLNWDLDKVVLTSISSYEHIRSSGFGSGCYNDVNNPIFPNAQGHAVCLSNVVAYGASALPGQVVELYQPTADNFDAVNQDFRISSAAGARIHWLVGASYLYRWALEQSGTTQQIAGVAGYVPLSVRADYKLDAWYGVYGEIGAKLTDKLDITVDLRDDQQRYTTTQFNNLSKSVVVPVRAPDGTLEQTQVANGNSLQPKGQLSYHVDQDRMVYLTVSQGFRAGYFNSGTFGIPEHTTNYEVGLKSMWLDRRLLANLAIFHIDYSNQQTSTTTNLPPYRVPVTIPQTKIDGVELESSFRVSHTISLDANAAYLNSAVSNHTQSPASPRWSGDIGMQILQPVAPDWKLNARADVNYHSAEYLFTNNTQRINPATFVNARIGFDYKRYGIYFVGKNLTSTREAQKNNGHPATFATRYENEPAMYGVELRAAF